MFRFRSTTIGDVPAPSRRAGQGIDPARTFRHAGRDSRPTVVEGEVVHRIIAGMDLSNS